MYQQGRLIVTDAELQHVNDRIRTTIGILDGLIANRRHLRLVTDQACSDEPSVADRG